MKTRLVAYAGGDTYAEILATIPAHEVVVTEDGTPANELEALFPQDSFAVVMSYPAGTQITRIGPGREGILGMPPDYAAVGSPATGDIIMKIRTKGRGACNFRVDEYETPRNN